MTLQTGQELSYYRILEAIGAGAMGEVYLARDTQLERDVAIKVLPEHLADDEELLQRFEREARMLAALNHHNVAQIFGVDQVDDVCFLVLEYVPGETLEDRLARGALPLADALDVCRQIAEGLEAAHEAGVIHRDLKPANVRITPEGRVKLLDLGLAKPVRPGVGDDDVLTTEVGRVLGTPAYMAPEQARGKAVDRRVDVWAFGCVLYECLSGSRAFGGATMAEVLVEILEREPDRTRLPAGLPQRVIDVLDRCLLKDPRQRLRDVGEARIALEEKTAGSTYAGMQPASSVISERGAATRLIVLAFTDVVDSTALKGRLGAEEYSRFVVWHDDAFRRLIAAMPGAEILKDVGDGFMTRFPTASQAVEAALVFQKRMATGPFASVPVQLRIGLHMGEVSELGIDVHGKAKVVGLAADLASRVMSLALPGQTLMTQAVFDNARLYVREFPVRIDAALNAAGQATEEAPLELRWIAHGAYEFKGSSEPLKVFEAGLEGLSPLSAPAGSEKAKRIVSAAEEQVLGWRPAVDREIPGRAGWALKQALHSDDQAEVWVGKHHKTDERRIFKFCFDAEHLKAFKSEIHLFKILRDQLGDRQDIAKLYEVQLDRPPFFLEVEHAPLGTLKAWCKPREGHEGLPGVPLGVRIEVLQLLAGAVAAAHSAGVIHKDIQPSTILVFRQKDGSIRPKLADFGAGVLANKEPAKGTDAPSWDGAISAKDLPVDSYTAPETLAEGAYTAKSDIYALGVLLFQMVVGDLARPLSIGWEADVEDELLREIIASCVQGRPEQRLGSADELAQLLGSLDERRRLKHSGEQEAIRTRRRKRRMRLAVVGGVGLALLLAAFFQVYGMRRSYLGQIVAKEGLLEQSESEVQEARQEALHSGDRARRAFYFANLLAADTSLRDGDIRGAKRFLSDCDAAERGWEWRHLAFKADASRLSLTGHEGPITCLAFSPAGDRIASGAQDGTLRLWDAADGKCLFVGRENDSPIRSAAYGPQGASLFTFGGDEGSLRSWSRSGELDERSRVAEEVFGFSCFSSDGELFAFCDEDNAVLIASRSTGRIVHRLPAQDDSVHALAFDRSAARLLLCSYSGLVLFDVELESTLSLAAAEGAASAVAFVPGGQDFVAGFEDGTLRRFDGGGLERWSSPGHTSVVGAVAFSPDGSRIASGSLDKSVRVWDAESGVLLTTYLGHEKAVRTVVYSPDGERIVSGGDEGKLFVWDGNGFAANRAWGGPESEGWMTSVALAPTGLRLLAGGGAGTLELRDADSGELLLSEPCDEGGAVEAVDFSPDGRHMAAAFEQSFVKLWALREGPDGPTTEEGPTLVHDDSVTSVLFSSDGKQLLTSDGDGVHRWTLDGTKLAPLAGEYGSILCLAVSEGGALIAAGSGDGKVYLWTKTSHSPVELVVPKGASKGIYELAFDASGARLLAGSEDGTLRIWDVDSRAPIGELRGHDKQVTGVAFSPDGTRAFSSSLDATVRVWDVEEARQILTLSGNRVTYGLELARDGSRLVAACHDNTVRCWEAPRQP